MPPTDPTHCPLPAVAQALTPYIHPRHETLLIRRTLDASLQAHFTTPLTHATLSLPHELCETSYEYDRERYGGKSGEGAGLGLRGRYIEVQRRLADAQRRYEKLSEDVKGLANDNPPKSTEESRAELLQEYTNLLRLRKQHARLTVIAETFSALSDAAPSQTRDLKGLVREKVGEPPVPPSSLLGETRDEGLDKVEEVVLRLRQAIIAAKGELDAAGRERERVKNGAIRQGVGDVEAQVRALRKARDELAGWLDEELRKVEGEGDEEHGKEPQAGEAEVEGQGQEEMVKRIEEAYERYIISRRRLKGTAEKVKAFIAEQQTRQESRTQGDRMDILKGAPVLAPPTGAGETMSSAAVLPLLMKLLTLNHQEKTTASQTSYTRRQLSAALEASRQTVQRLADESHLVAPATDDVRAWGVASSEAGEETRSVATSSLSKGMKSVDLAKKSLLRFAEERDALHKLLLDVERG